MEELLIEHSITGRLLIGTSMNGIRPVVNEKRNSLDLWRNTIKRTFGNIQTSDSKIEKDDFSKKFSSTSETCN